MSKINSELLQELENVKIQLEIPYPSDDIEQIAYDYNQECLAEDFYNYCSIIEGSLSYALDFKKIPIYQRKFLYKNFFQTYPQYTFLVREGQKYLEFHQQLIIYEYTRKLLIAVIETY
ncbi:YxiJ family protein [Bacillus sp. WLY-B-L8]|uniref:YxiJ family protein n=1 Tax=Bacillus multifaciens TaxID=3068506 RepID=UPI002741575F|nr:YxiJ family protein [Bacillus sp. WLY-B-L8]MDP7978542.1 YxiJ family protein [Bacillus sp. WLY-B-L8]